MVCNQLYMIWLKQGEEIHIPSILLCLALSMVLKSYLSIYLKKINRWFSEMQPTTQFVLLPADASVLMKLKPIYCKDEQNTTLCSYLTFRDRGIQRVTSSAVGAPWSLVSDLSWFASQNSKNNE